MNKCDNGIVVHRNRDPEQGPLNHVQVCGDIRFLSHFVVDNNPTASGVSFPDSFLVWILRF